MRMTAVFWIVSRLVGLTCMLLLSNFAIADIRVDELKRCLQDFGGIEWKLPYQPPMKVRLCANNSVSYDTVKEIVAGRHTLELIEELTLGRDGSQLPSNENYAALQNAAYIHFDSLVRRYGYRQVEITHADAQTGRDLRTLRMLAGQSATDEEVNAFNAVEAKKPPIPYVSQVRYVRSIVGQYITLTYKVSAANTLLITLDVPPGVADILAGAAR